MARYIDADLFKKNIKVVTSELNDVTRNRMQITDTSSMEYIMLTGRIQGLQQAKEAIEAV